MIAALDLLPDALGYLLIQAPAYDGIQRHSIPVRGYVSIVSHFTIPTCASTRGILARGEHLVASSCMTGLLRFEARVNCSSRAIPIWQSLQTSQLAVITALANDTLVT